MVRSETIPILLYTFCIAILDQMIRPDNVVQCIFILTWTMFTIKCEQSKRFYDAVGQRASVISGGGRGGWVVGWVDWGG